MPSASRAPESHLRVERTPLAILSLGRHSHFGRRPSRGPGRHRRSHRRPDRRRGQHACGAGECPRDQHLQRRALADDDQCSRPLLPRVPVGGRAVPDRGRAIGYEPARRDSIRLALGQRLTAHFALTPAVVQLQEITVTGTADPRFNAARTGPAQIISDSTIARLPVSRPRLYRAGPPLAPGHQESQRRPLLRGPARPVQQHPDRRDQQQRPLRQRRIPATVRRAGPSGSPRSPPRR